MNHEKIILESLENNEVTEKNYDEKWFLDKAFTEYEVQWNKNETVYSILNKMWAENLKNELKLPFRSLVLEAWRRDIFPIIKKWDKVIFEQEDNNSMFITIWEKAYMVNINAKIFDEINE